MKRILSLDGGGIRGIFSLQILARIESLFRAQNNKPDLVLAEVFDFIAGTSTGAIIATCLSWGMSVAEIEELYISKGKEMFTREGWLRRYWNAKYRADTISHFFRERFCEDTPPGQPSTLGTKKLRTLLLVLMRNASTGSPWPVSNNPKALYNDPDLPDCNLNIPLWQLVRASTAAPTFFEPEEISLGGQQHMFVDGGITPYNNPALIAVMMATLPSYRLCWPASREQLHLVSVGTGTVFARLPHKLAKKITVLDQLQFVIPALMGSVSQQQDIICRVTGDCVHGPPLDSEIGSLNEPTIFNADEQKFTYARYDQIHKVTAHDATELPQLQITLDNLSLIPALQKAGKKYADEHVRLEHLFPRSHKFV